MTKKGILLCRLKKFENHHSVQWYIHIQKPTKKNISDSRGYSFTILIKKSRKDCFLV